MGDTLRAFFAHRVPATDVDDLLQETYLRMTAGRAELRDQERFAAWVFRIARNLTVDYLRRRQHEVATELADESRYDEPRGERDAHHDVAEWLASFIDQLPEKYATVMRLSELSELTHREIADRIGRTVSAVKSRVQRGRAMLRQKLLACCSFEFDRRGRILDQTRNAPGDCDC